MWALARAPLPGLETRRAEIYNTTAKLRSAELCDIAHVNRLTRQACLRLFDGLPGAISDIVHEGAHIEFGDHKVEGRYDDSYESPYGWSVMVNDSLGNGCEALYGEGYGFEFFHMARSERKFIKLRQ